MATTPVTIPVPVPTGAKVGADVLQAPPLVALVSVLERPIQVDGVPPIDAGIAFTVYSLVA